MSDINDTLTAAFEGQFMQPAIDNAGYFLVETSIGTECVPADVIGHFRQGGIVARAFTEYVEGEVNEPDLGVEYHFGWIARLSARGYTDCTDWTWHDTYEEAAQHLIDTYGDED